MTTIRQPIVTVVGHVDHGKTSILDCLRDSCIQEGESGGITQKISFTSYPMAQLKKACPLIDKKGIKVDIPGFLLIDTPGHAAFTNLRKRGGALADLAVLVIDINEGIKPQTAEVIQILKHNKVPFVIALNKIDNISGWKKHDDDLQKSIEMQPQHVKQVFDERFYTFVGALQSYGLDADLFYTITDFTKKVTIVPCSAKTQEGIPELTMMLCGISQRYLSEKLALGKVPRGVVLEVKKEKAGNYAECILYDGELKKSDEIAVADLNGKPLVTKIRVLEEIAPLSAAFKPKDKILAATGFRMQLATKADILPGMPFVLFKNNTEDIEKEFKKELTESIQTAKQGIIAKADSLGSLEALLTLLAQARVPVVKAGIGPVNKSDIISAKANLEISELDAIIVAFNTSVDEETKGMQTGIKIFQDNVVYKLIENLTLYREEKAKEIEKRRMMQLASIGKVEVLHQFVFRNTSPAIFGVRVLGGKIISGLPLIDDKGEKVARLKHIQADRKSVNEATDGMEVAISLPGVNFERQMKNKTVLYSDISESQFKTFKKNKDLLSSKEIAILQEIAQIKREKKTEWGM